MRWPMSSEIRCLALAAGIFERRGVAGIGLPLLGYQPLGGFVDIPPRPKLSLSL
jgi:hypothetical protein